MSILNRLKLTSENRVTTLLSVYPQLTIEYEALCIRLVALIGECKAAPHSATLKKCLEITLQEAKEVNALLLEVYAYTNIHQNESARLQLHRKHFNAEKSKAEPSDVPPKTDLPLNSIAPLHLMSSAAKVGVTGAMGLFSRLWAWLLALVAFITSNNIFRLLTARLRRGLLNVKTFLFSLIGPDSIFQKIFDPFDKYFFGPLMNYLSWLFLLPRLLINLGATAWHTIKHDNLSEEEKTLTWTQRFMTQWHARWFELANDLVWVPGGILTCFFLIGPLNVVGLILGVALFGWDILMSVIRAVIELRALDATILAHQEELNNCTNMVLKEEKEKYIKELNKHWDYEINRHSLSITNNILVTVLTFLAAAILFLPPIVPMVASALLIVLTLTSIYFSYKIARSKPQSELEKLDEESYAVMSSILPPQPQNEITCEQAPPFTPVSKDQTENLLNPACETPQAQYHAT